MRRCARRPAGLLLLAVSASLVLLCGSASAATSTPTLLAPTSSSSSSTPLQVRYKLPEAASSVTLTFTLGETHTVVVPATAQYGAGEHTLSLQTHDLTASPEVKSASASSLADGSYEVTLTYENTALEAPASASATEVHLITATAAPTLLAPASGEELEGTFPVTYKLPENPLSGTVAVVFEGEEAGTSTVVLEDVSAGEHSVEIDPAKLLSEPGIFSAPAGLLPGGYKVHVQYQDALGNAAASSSPVTLTLLAAKCQGGTYSEDGRLPCVKASPGHYVEGTGATEQISCPLGRYNPLHGSSLASACVPAEPGHYVPSAGASAQIECSAGSYAALSERSLCTPAGLGHHVPAAGASAQLECSAGTYSSTTGAVNCQPSPTGHYAPAGSAQPVPCQAGTYEPGEEATSVAACLPDGPGYYSETGATAGTPCEAGSYAAGQTNYRCLKAEPGYFVAAEAASRQLPCPAGRYSPLSGASACVLSPVGTYAGEGATGPTACPAGTEAPTAGLAACTASPAAATPAPAPVVLKLTSSQSSAAAPKCAIAAAPRQFSLHRNGRQGYTLSCNLAATVSVRAHITITSAHRHITLAARSQSITTVAGATSAQLLIVRLSKTARALLSAPRARVSLSISVYSSGASSSAAPLGHAVLAGRR